MHIIESMIIHMHICWFVCMYIHCMYALKLLCKLVHKLMSLGLLEAYRVHTYIHTYIHMYKVILRHIHTVYKHGKQTDLQQLYIVYYIIIIIIK